MFESPRSSHERRTTPMNIFKKLGTLAVAFLIVPAGLALARTAPDAASTRADTMSTTTNVQRTFSKIQDLAQNIREEIGPLKFDTNGTQVTWKVHSTRLMKVKKQVNQMENEVNRIATRKASLPDWQQQLLGNVKRDTHELVYQTQAAVKQLNKLRNTNALALTRYPQYIDQISQKANDAASSIGTVFQRHGVDMD